MKYYSTASAAEALPCSRPTVNRAIRDGRLPARDIRLPGADKPRWRIAESDLEAFRQYLAIVREEPITADAEVGAA